MTGYEVVNQYEVPNSSTGTLISIKLSTEKTFQTMSVLKGHSCHIKSKRI